MDSEPELAEASVVESEFEETSAGVVLLSEVFSSRFATAALL